MTTAARIPTTAEIEAVLQQWSDWNGTRTDTLFALDERARTAGSPSDQADIAAAFVARKAIVIRLDEIRAAAQRDRRAALALTAAPIVDDLGGPVGSDLGDAANLLDAILQRVERNIAAAETRQTGELRRKAQINDDLAEVRRLSELLGSQVNRVAQLTQQVESVTDTNAPTDALAADLAALRAQLSGESADRDRLLAALASAPGRLDALRAIEVDVRELAARCREKVVQAPNLAVPSVAALGEVPAGAAPIEPWPSVRARVQPWLERLDRLAAAFEQARDRFQATLDQRDQQRGLLQAFRDKAADSGLGEHPELEPLYREAADVLWAAPCDLVEAAPLVQRYLEAVNARVGGARPPQRGREVTR